MGLYEGIKDVAKIAQQADNVDLYRKLLDLSAEALDMQDEIRRLKEENWELKKQKDIESKVERHQESYITFTDDEQKFKYCSHCWDSDRKRIQLHPWGNNYYTCPECKEEIYDTKRVDELLG